MTNTPLDNTNSAHNLDDQSIFTILKNRRLALKIELSEAADYLKIKTHNLEAIEESQLDMVPRSLYVIGIIRSYAKLLKIDQSLVEERIKSLTIESNISNKKYKLLNIGENLDLKPNREQFFNFLILSSLLFLLLLFLFNLHEKNNNAFNTQSLIDELSNVQ